MSFKLFFLFIVLPIAEIAVLLHVGDLIGGWNTFFIVILTALAGAHLVRNQGLATLAEIQKKASQGVLPAESLTEGLMILVAGILLVTPGFITDIFGLLLTLPLTRKPLAKVVMAQVGHKVFVAQSQNVYGSEQNYYSKERKQQNEVIEGQWERKDDN
ncbi:FxsA family protein [Gayadomonas joobiniege]|uniref:FxsA family protein n=1 Tax=Gayadomonas joobiniege TaxID=1234606 RepID=UPI00035F33EC|nr:FxsA family protein [Gayadomonas joobiniege]